MRVWLITIGEPIPTDEGSPRLLRTGLLANQLAARGHQVTWWNSAFDHMRKAHRGHNSRALEVRPGYRILLLAGPGYDRNVSFRRWIDHRVLARQFSEQARRELAPDLVVCSLPTLELAREAVEYGRDRALPVVLDLRDMWPDVFLDALPGPLRPLARPVLGGLYADLRYACRGATALTGITPEFVDWGLSIARRPRSPFDRHFWLAYSRESPPESELARARARWTNLGVFRHNAPPIVCFFGTLSGAFDMGTVIAAAERLEQDGRPMQFVLCGTGDRRSRWERQARRVSSVRFPGWVNRGEIWTLMRGSLAGLAPYRSRTDFVASLPTKSIEYLSASLPIASSLSGALQHLLERTGAGFTYPNGDASALAAGLLALHEHPGRRERMAAAAGSVYEAEFVAERIYHDMADYLETIAAGFTRD